MDAKVRDLMTPGPIGVDYHQTVAEAARVMRDWGVGAVLVLSDGKLSGLVTDRDIAIRVLAENRDPLATRVGDIASTDLAVLGPDDDVEQAVALLRQRALRRVPVVRDGIPVGMISVGDLALEADWRSALSQISAAPPNL
jgi:CBS domain-containing protein